MSAPAFTPGPWHQSGQAFDGEQHFIDICNGANGLTLATLTGYSPAEARANAYLIAAAPELYEALQAFVTAVESDSEPLPGTRWHREWTAARAALAKAVQP